jgi:hypothetical protein
MLRSVPRLESLLKFKSYCVTFGYPWLLMWSYMNIGNIANISRNLELASSHVETC